MFEILYFWHQTQAWLHSFHYFGNGVNLLIHGTGFLLRSQGSLTHEIPFHSWNMKFYYHAHKSLPLDLSWAGWVCTYSQVLFPRVILILSSHRNNSNIDNCILIVFGKSNSIVTNTVFLWVITCKGNESVGMYSMVCVLD